VVCCSVPPLLLWLKSFSSEPSNKPSLTLTISRARYVIVREFPGCSWVVNFCGYGRDRLHTYMHARLQHAACVGEHSAASSSASGSRTSSSEHHYLNCRHSPVYLLNKLWNVTCLPLNKLSTFSLFLVQDCSSGAGLTNPALHVRSTCQFHLCFNNDDNIRALGSNKSAMRCWIWAVVNVLTILI
jgi:hypothetical protein